MRPRIDSKARLRLLLGVVLVGLAVPASLLFRLAASQLDLEAFRRQQLIAEETVRRIDASLVAAIAIEERRPFSDYEFAVAAANARGNVVQRSPLSIRPATSALPGVIGHFQVDADGRLTTPLLPSVGADPGDFGIDAAERAARLAVENTLLEVLAENRLVRAQPEGLPGRAGALAFDDANRGGRRAEAVGAERDEPAAVEEAVADAFARRQIAAPAAAVRGQAVFDELAANARLEQSRAPEIPEQNAPAAAPTAAIGPASPATRPAEAKSSDTEVAREREARADDDGLGSSARVSAFETDLEPLQFSRLDTGHVVLFRNAWRDGTRFIQGMLLDHDAFLRGATTPAFVTGGHAAGARLLASIGAAAPIELTPSTASTASDRGDARVLHTARLSPPLAQVELMFRVGELAPGPAYRVLVWTAAVLAVMLLGGLYAIYRFGSQQIALTRQHQDFVSAVSHELKTPLTSIRMYGEMLKSGWASDEKRQSYYDYIFAEGERLSRLIDNVLQVARLNRGNVPVALEPIAVGELIDGVRSKVETSVERAGFTLTCEIEDAVRDARVLVDSDAFMQVFINLVDNALKFASDASRREIVVAAGGWQDRVLFRVRDFGDGIAPRDMKRLFELFYRPDNPRTRATAGTGIGLALVKQLVTGMHGRVDVRNCEPGAEFRVAFPRA